MNQNRITITKDDHLFMEKTTNSFFRSAHLDSIANQVAKKLGIKNDFTKTNSHYNIDKTPSSMDERIIHVDLKLTQREYSSLIGVIWDGHKAATGTEKKEVFRSLKDKFEKYYK